MSTISISLPNSLHNLAKASVSQDYTSMNPLITHAVAEKVSALTNETNLQRTH
jgi:hypothetical protein